MKKLSQASQNIEGQPMFKLLEHGILQGGLEREQSVKKLRDGRNFGFDERAILVQQVEAHLLSMERLIRWVETNCEIVAWSPGLASRREERKELGDVIGEESQDSVLAAVHPFKRERMI